MVIPPRSEPVNARISGIVDTNLMVVSSALPSIVPPSTLFIIHS